jgi:hypothetical protein
MFTVQQAVNRKFREVAMKVCIRLSLMMLIFCLMPITSSAQEKTSWADKLQISGDLRVRHESIYEQDLYPVDSTRKEKGHKPDRHRDRFRFRLQAKAVIHPKLDAYGRIASGSGNPKSGTQDMGGGTVPKPLWVDNAYFDYHPYKGTSLKMGKFAVPFEGTNLAWGGDLSVEGAALNIKQTLGPRTRVLGHLGSFWMEEMPKGADRALYSVQGGVEQRMGEEFFGQLTAGYFDFSQMKGNKPLWDATKPYGNTVKTVSGVSTYANQFKMLQLNGGVEWRGPAVTVALLGDFIQNGAAEKDTANTGWLAGFSVLNSTKPRRWEVAYDYRVLEADACVGTFTDSVFGNGNTNTNGHKVWLTYWFLESTLLRLSYYNNQLDPDGKNLNFSEISIDFEAKF